MGGEDDVGVASGIDEGQRTTQLGWQRRFEVASPGEQLRLASLESLHDRLVLALGEPRALRPDHDALVNAQVGSQVADGLQFGGRVTAAVHEVVGEAIPSDVECRIRQELLLQDVAEPEAVRVRHQIEWQEVVDDRCMTHEDEDRPTGELILSVDLHVQTEQATDNGKQGATPPRLQTPHRLAELGPISPIPRPVETGCDDGGRFDPEECQPDRPQAAEHELVAPDHVGDESSDQHHRIEGGYQNREQQDERNRLQTAFGSFVHGRAPNRGRLSRPRFSS